MAWTIDAKDRAFEQLNQRTHHLLGRVEMSLGAVERSATEREWEELMRFSEQLDVALAMTTDPRHVMKPARDEDGDEIPDIYVLRVGRWKAYFEVASKTSEAHLSRTAYVGKQRNILARFVSQILN